MLRRGMKVRSSTGWVDICFDPSTLVVNGVCDQGNSDHIARFLSAYVSLLGDSPLSKSHGHKPGRTIRKFIKELSSGSIRDVIKRFSSLAEQITSTCYTTGDGHLTGDFIHEMADTPVFKEYHHFYVTGSPDSLRYVLSFLKFGKKLEYQDESLHQIAFRDWLGVEDRLCGLSLPDYTSDLRMLIRWLLPSIRTESFYPHFGPGAVANPGVRGDIAKSNNLRYNHLIDRAFFSPYYKGNFGPPPRASVIPDLVSWLDTSSRELKSSALRFVPKDVTKSRSICMEPNSVMYFQQLVLDWMKASIDSGPLRHYIHLEDQNYNRNAAKHGSIYGSMDTIDLSSASDSVSIELVKRIFPRDFLYYMLATRTSHVKVPNGTVMRVKKFAPMGSAVCFPTQCIIFCSVVIYAMMRHDDHCVPGGTLSRKYLTEEGVRSFVHSRIHTGYEWFTPFTSMFECPQVYGDDIVCDSRVTDDVTRILSELGFVVNETKSYRSAQAVRESCGEWYFNGFRITPFTYRVKHSGVWLNPTSFASLIAAINNSGDWGYMSLRRALIRYALFTPLRKKHRWSTHIRPNRVRFVAQRDEFGILSKDVSNPHLKRRYNRDLQLEEALSEQIVVKKRRKPKSSEKDNFDLYLYLQDTRTRYFAVDRPDFTFGLAKYRPEETGLAGRWIPCRE